jgi:DNA invertase Pin-like site-specific DNA recombinase
MKNLGKGEMTVSEMGKLGGLAKAAKCTPEQLSAIGRYGYEHGLAKYSPAQRREMLRTHGRPSVRLSEKKISLIRKLFKSGVPQARIAETMGVGRPTIARRLHRGKWRKTAKKPSV